MTRAPIVLAATAAGLAAALGFTPHSRPGAAAAVIAATSHSTAPTSGGSSAASRGSSAAPRPTAKTVTGAAISTQYGNVQLKIKVSGNTITDVVPVQLPYGDPKSSEISTYAAPMLRQSALSKQSASVDAVSGATYTSAGYATALQSALDKAGIKNSASATTSSGG